MSYLSPSVSLSLSMYIYIYIYTYIHTYIRTYVHTYIHTYMHACMHAYIHTYVHTHIYIYIYIYIHTNLVYFFLAAKQACGWPADAGYCSEPCCASRFLLVVVFLCSIIICYSVLLDSFYSCVIL